ncbi:replication factor RFC1 C terminal domain-containing protein [Obelidium mucronatum]|nr:replication factor RFC1 C terminal domain-containing protein [Obelidium mucronatum]
MKILAKKSSGGPAALGSKEIPVGEDNCLMGLTFVFTGELSSISRDDAQDLVKRYGGRVTGGVSGKTSYVVVGEEAGQSKLGKAATLKIKTLDEDQLFELVRNSKGKAEKGSTATKAGSAAAAAKKAAPVSAASLENKPPPASVAELWTTKYKPTKYDEVMGNKKNVERLATWLKSWNASTASDKPNAMKDEPGASRAILISGPPGIGKTTAAHLVATIEGFEIVEFNASDTRSKKSVGDVVKEMTGSHTLAEYFVRDSDKRKNLVKRQVLIMDEVDGMSAGDRGGITELINIIKKTKIPIICICNDRQSPKVKSLVNHCYDMRFSRCWLFFNKGGRVKLTIFFREGLDIKQNAMDTLVKGTHSDIRQILNMLSTYSLQSSELTFDQSRNLSKSSEKNMTMSPWDVTGTLLNRGSFRDASFADKLELYFNDFSLIPLMIQENYIKMDPSLAHENGGPSKIGQDIEALNCLSQAADAIAYGDIISSVQMKTQNWGLLPFHGVTSTLRPAFFTHGTVVAAYFYGGGFAFPSWLGKNSNQTKNVRLLKEIQMHMRLHVSADKNEVRQSYLPALAPLLTVPLLDKENASEAIEKVIHKMDEYYLTREDWDSILELGLEECGAKALTANIATATKSAFTRTYNKANHPKPFMSASLLGKVSRASGGGGAGGGGGSAPDLDDVVENDDDVVAAGEDEPEDEDEDAVGADRLIKQKVASKSGGAAASKKASGSGGAGRGGKRAADSAGKASSSSSKKQKK